MGDMGRLVIAASLLPASCHYYTAKIYLRLGWRAGVPAARDSSPGLLLAGVEGAAMASTVPPEEKSIRPSHSQGFRDSHKYPQHDGQKYLDAPLNSC